MPLPALNDRQYLVKQYKNASNLDVRIRLHQRFRINTYGWFPWVFDHFDLPARCQVLELGCGTGDLWLENLSRIPPSWRITLSDFSTGMLERTCLNLKGQSHIQFKILDAQSIPFGVATFDAVIANHMLYHIPDLPATLAEIRRILKPAGIFYASTVGDQHLVEIGELIRKFDPDLNSWGGAVDAFTLENGIAQLSEWFTQVTLYRYEDALEVTDARLLMDYILSGREYVPVERQAAFSKFLVREMEAGAGVIHITKDSGLFVCV